MPQSEVAIACASRVASISQVHFSGADDTVVLHVVAQRFVDAARKRCARARTIPDATRDARRATATGGDCGPRCWRIPGMCRAIGYNKLV
jgi:hypothetical protein